MDTWWSFIIVVGSLYTFGEAIARMNKFWIFPSIIEFLLNPTEVIHNNPRTIRYIVIIPVIWSILLMIFFSYTFLKLNQQTRHAQSNVQKCINIAKDCTNTLNKVVQFKNDYYLKVVECSEAKQAAEDLGIYCSNHKQKSLQEMIKKINQTKD